MAVVLSDDLKAAINSSRADGFPVLWASVDESGQPTIAIYGSTHVHSDHELGLWLRNEGRGFLSRTGKNAKVFGWFRNTSSNVACQIVGEARRVTDAALRDRVYDESPEAERKMDEAKASVAVIVDIVRVIQRGQVVASRD